MITHLLDSDDMYRWLNSAAYKHHELKTKLLIHRGCPKYCKLAQQVMTEEMSWILLLEWMCVTTFFSLSVCVCVFIDDVLLTFTKVMSCVRQMERIEEEKNVRKTIEE